MGMMAPVIREAWSLARKATTAETSGGSPNRPNGIWSSIGWAFTGSPQTRSAIGVKMTVGATALTVTPRPPHSSASTFVIIPIAALDAP